MQFALEHGADYVMVLNNDTVLHDDCVTQLMEWVPRAAHLGAVSPKILFHDDPGRIWFAGGDFSRLRALGLHRRELERDDPREAPRLDEVSFLTGCCML